MDPLLAGLVLLVGLVVLVVAAEVFVAAAEGVAIHLRWSPAVIGAVVVGFGTSLPELVTSVLAAAAGDPDLAVGNAAGSNVANLTLILGIAALVAPLAGAARGSGRDLVIAGTGGLALVAVALDGRIGALDGALLVTIMFVMVGWQIATARGEHLEVAADVRPARLWVRVVLGLGGVILGARLLVDGAQDIAVAMGVPTIVIGAVLVAVGTSLPELATAVASARRGQSELLMGNLIGSNAFNALAVVGSSALVARARGGELATDAAAMSVVVAAAAVTLLVGVWLWRSGRVGRLSGALLVVVYVGSVPALLAVG